MILRYCGLVFSKSLDMGRVKRVGLGIFRFASLRFPFYDQEAEGVFTALMLWLSARVHLVQWIEHLA